MTAKDINLLPEEFRDKDRKEKESVRKKPKIIRIDMSNPQTEQKARVPVQPKPSLLSRLFSGKIGPPKPLPDRPPEEKVLEQVSDRRDQTKEMHIPVSSNKSEDVRVDLLSGGFLFGKKDVKPQPIPDAVVEEELEPEVSQERGKERVKLEGGKAKRRRRRKKGRFFKIGKPGKEKKDEQEEDDDVRRHGQRRDRIRKKEIDINL